MVCVSNSLSSWELLDKVLIAVLFACGFSLVYLVPSCLPFHESTLALSCLSQPSFEPWWCCFLRQGCLALTSATHASDVYFQLMQWAQFAPFWGHPLPEAAFVLCSWTCWQSVVETSLSGNIQVTVRLWNTCWKDNFKLLILSALFSDIVSPVSYQEHCGAAPHWGAHLGCQCFLE